LTVLHFKILTVHNLTAISFKFVVHRCTNINNVSDLVHDNTSVHVIWLQTSTLWSLIAWSMSAVDSLLRLPCSINFFASYNAQLHATGWLLFSAVAV